MGNIDISGQSVLTSVSGNVVNIGNVVQQVLASSTPTVYVGVISGITYLSGGTQLPDIPCGLSASIVGGTFQDVSGEANTNILVGGLGNNAPYYDNTTSGRAVPAAKGLPDNFPIGITNLNQIRVVTASNASGVIGWFQYVTVG